MPQTAAELLDRNPKPTDAQIKNGLTYQEIAQAMQMEVHSVGTKLARAEAEFSALYERHQRRQRKTQQLQTAKEGQ